MAKTIEDIIKSLEEMKLSELNELVKAIEDHFGVVASMGVAQAITDSAPAAGPSEVTIILTNAGASKVPVIKELAAITDKNLMEVQAMTKKLPAIIKEKIKPEEADEIKARLMDKGASFVLTDGGPNFTNPTVMAGTTDTLVSMVLKLVRRNELTIASSLNIILTAGIILIPGWAIARTKVIKGDAL